VLIEKAGRGRVDRNGLSAKQHPDGLPLRHRQHRSGGGKPTPVEVSYDTKRTSFRFPDLDRPNILIVNPACSANRCAN